MLTKQHVWLTQTKMIIKELLRDAKSQLAESGISEVDAEHLLAHVLGLSRMDLHNSVLVESTLLGIEDKDVFEEQFFDDGPGRFNVLGERVNDQEEADYENGLSPNTARSLGLPADGDYLGENVNAQEAVLTGNENVSSPSFTARSSLPKEDDDISDHSDNSSPSSSMASIPT